MELVRAEKILKALLDQAKAHLVLMVVNHKPMRSLQAGPYHNSIFLICGSQHNIAIVASSSQ